MDTAIICIASWIVIALLLSPFVFGVCKASALDDEKWGRK